MDDKPEFKEMLKVLDRFIWVVLFIALLIALGVGLWHK